MNKYILAVVVLLSSLSAYAGKKNPAYGTIYVSRQSQIYEDVTGNMVFVDGSVNGPKVLSTINTNGYILSTSTVNSGLGTQFEYMYLTGNTTAYMGTPLQASAPVGGLTSVSVPAATVGNQKLIGISMGTVYPKSMAQVATGGFALARTTGTVVAGSILTTSLTTGYLSLSTGTVWGADFGLALSTGTSSGGLTLIKIRK